MRKNLFLLGFFVIAMFLFSFYFVSASLFSGDSPGITGQPIKTLDRDADLELAEIKEAPTLDRKSVEIEEIKECIDSDGKDEFLEKGYIDFNGEKYEDYCEDDVSYDYYCKDRTLGIIGNIIRIIGNVISEDKPLFTSKNCKDFGNNFYCEDGKCMVEAVSCEDSDLGKNYYLKGNILGEDEGGKIIETQDYCEEGKLVEYYCDAFGKVNSEDRECECIDGECSSDSVLLEGRSGSDYVPMSSVMAEAEKSLNVKGFDVASAVGTTFSDSINPYSGALTITQTDVSVPQRNGMGITLSRTYSSNIFLHTTANENNIVDCNIENVNCPECTVADNIGGNCLDYNGLLIPCAARPMNKCENQQGLASSYIRSKFLGLGWDMTPGKIQDPTSLLFKDGAPTYKYVSARGVNSLNMVIDNNANSLIVPSMYRDNDIVSYTGQPELDLTGLSYSPYVNCAGWSTNVGNPSGNIDSWSNRITELQNWQYQDQNSGAFLIDNTFTGYTSSLEPVFISFWPIPYIMYGYSGNPNSGANGLGEIGLQQAFYYSKNGNTYFFGYYVPFCGKFDDMRNPCVDPDQARCVDIDNIGSCSGYGAYLGQSIANFAENPYAGNYLEYEVDNFGNRLIYTYYGQEQGDVQDHTPFIKFVNSGVSNPTVYFSYFDDESEMDIDTRLDYIKFVGPRGDYLYRIYEYANLEDGQPDLLTASYVSSSLSPRSPVSGTKYEFEYDPISKELVKVKLPTGAEVEYTYAWAQHIPINELLRFDGTSFGNMMSRRVVAVRTVTNGGECPSITLPGGVSSGGNSCKWVYQYKPVPYNIEIYVPNHGSEIFPAWQMETTVYDPFGGKTVYHSYAGTQNSVTTQHAFGQEAIDQYGDYLCDAS